MIWVKCDIFVIIDILIDLLRFFIVLGFCYFFQIFYFLKGKYGYVDVNGEVKIIEYGANAMGFQPQGDLPDGIIIPPPVVGNCTECDYDYDYEYVEVSGLGNFSQRLRIKIL